MNRLLALVLFATSLFAQGGSQLVSVTVEIPLSAWQLSAGSRIETLPDGQPALEVGYGSSAYVDLGISPLQLQGPIGSNKEGRYKLTFSDQNYFPPYPGYYQFEVDFGTQELCSAEGWGMMNFTEFTIECGGPGYIVVDQALPSGGLVQGSNHLIINLTVPGWPIHFRKVSFTFTSTH